MKSISYPRRGFTLIELLVVVAIIAMLASILFPVFAKTREKARQTSCLNSQRQIAVGIQMLTQDNEETYPDAESVWKDLKLEKGILVCKTESRLANGYGYNLLLSGYSAAKLKNPDTILLTGDCHPDAKNILASWLDLELRHGKGAIMSFADGHVAFSKTVMPSIITYDDLFLGLPNGSLVNNTAGWTRTPLTDNPSYPFQSTFYDTTSGNPAPCLIVRGITVTRALSPSVAPADINQWCLTLDWRFYSYIGSNSATVPDKYVTVLDANGNTIVTAGFFREYNVPTSGNTTLSVKSNLKVLYSEVVSNANGSQWPRYQKFTPVSITASRGSVYCQIGDKSVTTSAGTGSDWSRPAKVVFSTNAGPTDDLSVDNLRYGDY